MTDTQSANTAAGGLSPKRRLGQYLELTKARLSGLVLLSTLTAYLVAGRGEFQATGFLWTLLGTGLCALSANALNQVWETERDARMERTRHRPLPAGAFSRTHALTLALGLGLLGLLLLQLYVNNLAAGLALLTLLLYVLAYTPLKPRSPINTLVGAVCGAIPPLIGWAGAAGRLDGGAWLLFLLLFVWQIPHFLSLAWLYREDYARGGYRMLPAVDPSGQLTGLLVVVYSLAMLPLGLMLHLAGLAGAFFLAGFTGLALLLTGLSVRHWRHLSPSSARQLFLASVMILPLVFGLLLADPGRADRGALADGDESIRPTELQRQVEVHGH